MIHLRPIRAEDADILFPLVFQTPVCDTLVWDGPRSLEEYRAWMTEHAEEVRAQKEHTFTIVEDASGKLAGTIAVRPYAEPGSADIGIWIGVPYQGKGYGAAAIRLAVEYGFTQLHLEKIEAYVFVGNHASRRAFEKNGFQLEGTVQRGHMKHGVLVDKWQMARSVFFR
jgi:RimJ/RimL family protein N-acetyltransferase